MNERRWASYAAAIREHYGPFECQFTRAPGHAVELAEEEAKRGRELIVAVGGDGTVSEVANGILRSGTGASLGLLPGGSGGDFRRTLKIPGNMVDAAKHLKNAKDHTMDVGRIEYLDHNGSERSRYFVNTASFGMSGAVATRANNSSKVFGGAVTYATATLQTIMNFDAPEIFLEADEPPAKRIRVIIVCVANGSSFGGGMQIAPDAKLDDGFFDVVIAGDMHAVKLLFSSYKLYSGTHLSMEKMAHLLARTVRATAVDPSHKILLEVDGETPGRLPATIKILPKLLRVRC